MNEELTGFNTLLDEFRLFLTSHLEVPFIYPDL